MLLFCSARIQSTFSKFRVVSRTAAKSAIVQTSFISVGWPFPYMGHLYMAAGASHYLMHSFGSEYMCLIYLSVNTAISLSGN